MLEILQERRKRRAVRERATTLATKAASKELWAAEYSGEERLWSMERAAMMFSCLWSLARNRSRIWMMRRLLLTPVVTRTMSVGMMDIIKVM